VKGLTTLVRDLLRLRLFVCLNIVFAIVLMSAAQAQGQPGSGPSENGAPSKTNSVPPDQRVVLKVGDVQITQATFEQYLSDLEAQQGPPEASTKKLGDNYASMLMLSRVAAEKHLDKTPDVERQLAIDRMQILSNAEFAKMKAGAIPTKEEIQSYYNAHLEDYDVIQVRRFFIWAGDPKNNNQLTTEKAKALADSARQIYKSGGDPARLQKLVKEIPHNNDEIVIDEQPLTFQRGELPGKMNDTAFSLKPGEWTEMNNGPGAYLFFQVVNRSRKDLPQVSAQIEKKLQNQKLKAELEGLKKKTGIWMDETYFVSRPEMPQFGDRD
jgi:hypothetical protein